MQALFFIQQKCIGTSTGYTPSPNLTFITSCAIGKCGGLKQSSLVLSY